MTEVAIEISGYEGRYWITKQGEIINRKGICLVSTKDKHGYLRVSLHKPRSQKTHFVHRLVCDAYLPNPDNKPMVNHINGVRHDNRLENLEWCTAKENIQHSFRNGRIGKSIKGENCPQHILKEADIPTIRKLLSDGKKSLREIGEIYKVSPNTIYSVKSGKNWRHVK